MLQSDPNFPVTLPVSTHQAEHARVMQDHASAMKFDMGLSQRVQSLLPDCCRTLAVTAAAASSDEPDLALALLPVILHWIESTSPGPDSGAGGVGERWGQRWR